MHLKTSSLKGFLTLCLLAGFATLFLTSLSFAREPLRTVTGKVTKVSDGDTIQVTTPEQTKLRVRLYGIDAPETPKINQRTGRVNKPGQPYGKESWKALEGKIIRKQVRLDIIDIDQYKRMVGMIWIGNRNIKSIPSLTKLSAPLAASSRSTTFRLSQESEPDFTGVGMIATTPLISLAVKRSRIPCSSLDFRSHRTFLEGPRIFAAVDQEILTGNVGGLDAAEIGAQIAELLGGPESARGDRGHPDDPRLLVGFV